VKADAGIARMVLIKAKITEINYSTYLYDF